MFIEKVRFTWTTGMWFVKFECTGCTTSDVNINGVKINNDVLITEYEQE